MQNQAQICQDLTSILGQSQVHQNVLMKDHTSMRTGGMADFLVEPDGKEGLHELVSYLKENAVPFYVMGNGSNLIVSDDGFSGVFIKIGNNLSSITVEGETMLVQAGATLAAAAAKAWEEGLTGLEFASGIPGSMGGAAYMNAGAYDGEMSQVITRTYCMDSQGNEVILSGRDHEFGYRHSKIMDLGLIVTEVVLTLHKGDKAAIREKMNDLNARRRDKQPLNLPSAGSVFKRPEGYFAGKLIQDCGLRGARIGGAQVSEKHCGFIVNTGNATSSDIMQLIALVRDKVYKETGVLLEPEVRIIGGRQP